MQPLLTCAVQPVILCSKSFAISEGEILVAAVRTPEVCRWRCCCCCCAAVAAVAAAAGRRAERRAAHEAAADAKGREIGAIVVVI